MVYLLWLISNFYEDYFSEETDLKISQKISLRILFVNILYNVLISVNIPKLL